MLGADGTGKSGIAITIGFFASLDTVFAGPQNTVDPGYRGAVLFPFAAKEKNRSSPIAGNMIFLPCPDVAARTACAYFQAEVHFLVMSVPHWDGNLLFPIGDSNLCHAATFEFYVHEILKRCTEN